MIIIKFLLQIIFIPEQKFCFVLHLATRRQLPPMLASQPDLNNQPQVIESKTHEVQPKESLYAISKKYDVTVAQLKEWNNLKDDSLKTGQLLIISK